LLLPVFACVLAAVAPEAASAQPAASGDWPQFQANAAHSGILPDAPAPPYAPIWTVQRDAPSGQRLSPPVAVGDSVVVASPDALRAYDASSGSERWSVARDGAAVSPAIARVSGAQVVVYTDGRGPGTSNVQAVELETGEPVWDAPPTLQDESRTGVTIDGTRAFVGDESGRVYAIDLDRGAVAWTETAGTLAGPVTVGGGVVAAVVAASDTERSTTIVAFDVETGDRRWSVTPDATATFGSLPAIVGGAVVVAFPDGTVLGLSTSDGSQVWSERIPALVSPFVAPAVVSGSVVLADSNGGLHRLSPGGGTSWLFAFNEPVLRSSPVVAGESGVVGFEDGSIGAVALDTGHLVFRSPAAGVPVSGIALIPDAVIVTRSGSGPPSIVAFGTDAAAALLDVVSPTVPVAADLALGFALALAVGAIILLPARRIASRTPIEDPSEAETEDAEDATGEDRT
jgi:outer membrane protein assembly factor BamB